jgi:hypothetical protein
MSRLSRQCAILNTSQPYRPPWPVYFLLLGVGRLSANTPATVPLWRQRPVPIGEAGYAPKLVWMLQSTEKSFAIAHHCIEWAIPTKWTAMEQWAGPKQAGYFPPLHPVTETEPDNKMLCISNIPKTTDYIQYNICIILLKYVYKFWLA